MDYTSIELTGNAQWVARAKMIRNSRMVQNKMYFTALENLDATLAKAPDEATRAKINEAAANLQAKLDKVFGHTEAAWWVNTEAKITLDQLANA